MAKGSGGKERPFAETRFGLFLLGVLSTCIGLPMGAIIYHEVLKPEIHMLIHGRWTTGVVTEFDYRKTPTWARIDGEYWYGVVFTDHLGRERTTYYLGALKRSAAPGWHLFTSDPRGDSKWVLYEPTEDGRAIVFTILDDVVRPLALILLTMVFAIFAIAGFHGAIFGLIEEEETSTDG